MSGLLTLLGTPVASGAAPRGEPTLTSLDSEGSTDFAELFSQVLSEAGQQPEAMTQDEDTPVEGEERPFDGPENPGEIMDPLFELGNTEVPPQFTTVTAQSPALTTEADSTQTVAPPAVPSSAPADHVEQIPAETELEADLPVDDSVVAPVASEPAEMSTEVNEKSTNDAARGEEPVQVTPREAQPVSAPETPPTETLPVETESEVDPEVPVDTNDHIVPDSAPSEASAPTPTVPGEVKTPADPAATEEESTTPRAAAHSATTEVPSTTPPATSTAPALVPVAVEAVETKSPVPVTTESPTVATVTNPVATTQNPTPTTVASPAATVAAAPPSSLPQPVSTQLAGPVHQMMMSTGREGTKTMTVNLASENFGPVTVRASFTSAGVRIELFTPQDAGRETLRSMLGDLRRDLAGLGMTVGTSHLSVSSAEPPNSASQNQGRSSEGFSGDLADHDQEQQRQRRAFTDVEVRQGSTATLSRSTDWTPSASTGAGLDLLA